MLEYYKDFGTRSSKTCCDYLLCEDNDIPKFFCEKYGKEQIGGMFANSSCMSYKQSGSCYLDKKRADSTG
jgi:hypothetical protein